MDGLVIGLHGHDVQNHLLLVKEDNLKWQRSVLHPKRHRCGLWPQKHHPRSIRDVPHSHVALGALGWCGSDGKLQRNPTSGQNGSVGRWWHSGTTLHHDDDQRSEQVVPPVCGATMVLHRGMGNQHSRGIPVWSSQELTVVHYNCSNSRLCPAYRSTSSKFALCSPPWCITLMHSVCVHVLRTGHRWSKHANLACFLLQSNITSLMFIQTRPV